MDGKKVQTNKKKLDYWTQFWPAVSRWESLNWTWDDPTIQSCSLDQAVKLHMETKVEAFEIVNSLVLPWSSTRILGLNGYVPALKLHFLQAM